MLSINSLFIQAPKPTCKIVILNHVCESNWLQQRVLQLLGGSGSLLLLGLSTLNLFAFWNDVSIFFIFEVLFCLLLLLCDQGLFLVVRGVVQEDDLPQKLPNAYSHVHVCR